MNQSSGLPETVMKNIPTLRHALASRSLRIKEPDRYETWISWIFSAIGKFFAWRVQIEFYDGLKTVFEGKDSYCVVCIELHECR